MADYTVSYSVTHDETKPAGNRARSLGDDDIREGKEDWRERFGTDHVAASDETGIDDIGIHKQVTLKISSSDPTTYDNVGYLYIKTTGGQEELFWKDDQGNVLQLSVAGVINDSVLAKTGDWMLSSVTTARTGWTNVTATYADKFIRLNATPLGTGGADTHTHGVGSFAGPSHTHTVALDDAFTSGTVAEKYLAYSNTSSNEATSASGTGAITGTSASASNVPAYVETVVFEKD